MKWNVEWWWWRGVFWSDHSVFVLASSYTGAFSVWHFVNLCKQTRDFGRQSTSGLTDMGFKCGRELEFRCSAMYYFFILVFLTLHYTCFFGRCFSTHLYPYEGRSCNSIAHYCILQHITQYSAYQKWSVNYFAECWHKPGNRLYRKNGKR